MLLKPSLLTTRRRGSRTAHPPRCPRGCGDLSPPIIPTQSLPPCRRGRDPSLPLRCPRACGNPEGVPWEKRTARPLSSRMRGPIPPPSPLLPRSPSPVGASPVGASLVGALPRDCYENRLPSCTRSFSRTGGSRTARPRITRHSTMKTSFPPIVPTQSLPPCRQRRTSSLTFFPTLHCHPLIAQIPPLLLTFLHEQVRPHPNTTRPLLCAFSDQPVYATPYHSHPPRFEEKTNTNRPNAPIRA